MFEPVTSSSVPGGPTSTSLATRRSRRDQRVAERLRGHNHRRSTRRSSGRAPARVVAPGGGERRQRIQLADRLQPRAHARAGRAAPAVEREQHVKVPQRERLNRKVQDRRAAAELREPENAIQPPHAGRRGDAVRRQPLDAGRAAPGPRSAGRRRARTARRIGQAHAARRPPDRTRSASPSAIANDRMRPSTSGISQRAASMTPV